MFSSPFHVAPVVLLFPPCLALPYVRYSPSQLIENRHQAHRRANSICLTTSQPPTTTFYLAEQMLDGVARVVRAVPCCCLPVANASCQE